MSFDTEDEMRETEEALWIENNSQRDPVRDAIDRAAESYMRTNAAKLAMFYELVQAVIDCEPFVPEKYPLQIRVLNLLARVRKLQRSEG